MKPPILHISSNHDWMCGLIKEGPNWSEKYMDDGVARFLEFCKDCEFKYIDRYGQSKFDNTKKSMRDDNLKDIDSCDCGCHPEEGVKSKLYIKPTKVIYKVRTLRMFLENP